MRCLALAQAWQDEGGEVTLVTAAGEEGLLHRLRSERIRIVNMQAPAASDEDAEFTAHTARQAGAHWLVLDGYHFKRGYHAIIKTHDLQLLVLDDIGGGDLSLADAILNQNAYATPGLYAETGGKAALLLGVAHTMLRREFRLRRQEWTEAPERATRVLVTLGGSDPSNATLAVIRALAAFTMWPLEVKIILGPTNPHLASLRQELAALQACHDARLLVNPPDMPALMAWSHLAISASGSSCWELCCLGVPMLLVMTAANQAGVIRHLTDSGIAWSLGEDPASWTERFGTLAASREKRSCMSRNAQLLTDGQGACRVARFLHEAQ